MNNKWRVMKEIWRDGELLKSEIQADGVSESEAVEICREMNDEEQHFNSDYFYPVFLGGNIEALRK